MFAVAVVAVLLAIAIAIAATITVKIWRGPGRLPAPGQAGGVAAPPGPPAGPDGQTFVIQGDPGFIVRSRPRPRPGARQDPLSPKPTAASPTGFTYVEVNQNMNAICKFNGRPVGECGCDRHKGSQRKGRPT